MIEQDDKRIKFVPLDTVTQPPGGLIEHLKDRYWVYVEGKGIVFWHSGDLKAPQCNSDRRVVEMMIQKAYPWATVLFVPSVFRKIDPRDYC